MEAIQIVLVTVAFGMVLFLVVMGIKDTFKYLDQRINYWHSEYRTAYRQNLELMQENKRLKKIIRERDDSWKIEEPESPHYNRWVWSDN